MQKIVKAKSNNQNITVDWYKEVFLKDEDLKSDDMVTHAGLNKKSITNMHNSATRKIILDASLEYYDILHNSIGDLIQLNQEMGLILKIKFQDISIDLNIEESLMIINALAVKKSQIRGGLWNQVGKIVEKQLMITLCKLYNLDKKYYSSKTTNINKNKIEREADFYLLNKDKEYRCEVKLMGKGNPESVDAAFARSIKIFIADKLSDQNKKQLDLEKIYWVELRSKNGFKKFGQILKYLNISHKPLDVSENKLNQMLEDMFDD